MVRPASSDKWIAPLETRLRNISLKEVAKSRWAVTFTHIEKLKKQFIRTQTQQGLRYVTSFDWLRESLLGVDHTRKRENNQGSIIINTIIGRGWAKYRDFSVASRAIICRDRRLRQIFELWDTDKSRYFAITEFNIVLSFDHRVCFLMNIFWKRSDHSRPQCLRFWLALESRLQSDLPFSRKSDRKREKSVVSFTLSRISFAAKHSWKTVRISRPLSVGSHLLVTWGALDQ